MEREERRREGDEYKADMAAEKSKLQIFSLKRRKVFRKLTFCKWDPNAFIFIFSHLAVHYACC